MTDRRHIRNFCIIAHIDHGKSTLADRILEATHALSAREMTDQVLDTMDLERERGITIKAQAVRLVHAVGATQYFLNLIDTPGHVDFSYEVSRSLAACEGALLVIDAAQGIEAQTLANFYLADQHRLAIIPVINKIDLPGADPDGVRDALEETLAIDGSEAILTSAKLGTGIDELLRAVVERIPPPAGDPEAPLKALIFDSHFDPYRGVIAHVRVVDGSLRVGQGIRMMAQGASFTVAELGVFTPRPVNVEVLGVGEVGYLAASIKRIADARVGDTVTDAQRPARERLAGYRPVIPMVFAGLYPADPGQYDALREALEKLQLNDAALSFEPETSAALGFGFRAGFLGLLHLDIVQERLEREYGLELVTTAPNVTYRVTDDHGQVQVIQNPADMSSDRPPQLVEEPVVAATVIAPADCVGAIMELCQERRGRYIDLTYPDPRRVVVRYSLPLGEIMYDFFDALKSRTRGYASFDYTLSGYEPADLVKVDILLQGEVVDALSFICHRDRAAARGREVCERLVGILPRQLFEVAIQAAIGHRIIARETVRALRKDVLSKCYGGDVTRKRKLLEKQKEGKRRMRRIGRVEVPQEAFMAVLRRE